MRSIVLALFAVLVIGNARAGDIAIPQRIDAIKAGEWMLMEDVSGGDRAGETNRITVTDVGDKSVTMRRDHYAPDGTLIESREREIEKSRMRERLADMQKNARKITREYIMIKDKQMPVVAVNFERPDRENKNVKRDFILWISDELPLGGIAKMWCSDPDFPQAEVMDYGF